MHMVNVTEIRRNIRAVLAKVVQTKEPAIILQRSKPVAYVVDAETFEKMQQPEKAGLWARSRRENLERILRLRAKVAERTGVQADSTPLIRQLREGRERYE